MATINPDDIPDDKLDAVIERLTKEKQSRIEAKVAAGEAIKVKVSVVGDEDIEEAKAKSLRAYGIPPDQPVHFEFYRYEYPPMPDGSRNPMNGPVPEKTGTLPDPEAAQSHRYDDELARRPLPAWEPQEPIVGGPMTVWTEIRRPGPNSLGEIAEGYFLIHRGRVHLCDHLGKAIPGYSDIAGIDPMARARKLLRSKAMRERPDRFWTDPARVQPTGGY